MKAIKIASGVAVTALAAAISAQANAAAHEEMGDAEFSWSATGSMEFLTVMDMAPGYVNADGDEVTVIDVELDEEDDFDSGATGDGWGLQVKNAVTYGPLSGNVIIAAEDVASEGSMNTRVDVEDIVVTDGAISFGQVGSLVDATHEYAYDMGDSNDDVSGNSEGQGVGAGLRYTMEGLKVQIEGVNRDDDGAFSTTDADADEDGTPLNTQADIDAAATSDYGVAAQFMGEADALSYVAEAQFRSSSLGGSDHSAYTYVGAGATYTMDMVTAKVGLNRYTETDQDRNDESVLEYGFELEATPIDALSVYVKGQDLDSGSFAVDDSMKLLGGAAYTLDMLTFTGEYLYTDADNGDEIMGEVAYSDGPIGAYGSVTVVNFDADTADSPTLEAGASYTQDNGVKYAADWDMRAENTDATVNQAEVHNIRFSAAYAF